MGFLDSAQQLLSEGANAAHDVVSKGAVGSSGFMRGFAKLCNDGSAQGWHERNGGNLSYRLSGQDLASARPFFNKDAGGWQALGVQAPNLANQYFACTAAGSFIRNISHDLDSLSGIVELNDQGDAYRIVWGFADGAKPTSELPSHILNHAVRAQVTDGACRVLYHAHPSNLIAMTAVLPLDARTFSRALWKAMTECIIAFPKGIGVVETMVPGSLELAHASSELFQTYDAVIWALHGVFVSGTTFDDAFGLMQTIEKAAGIYVRARAINGGRNEFRNTISDEALRVIARELGLSINEAFLDIDSLV